MCSIPCSMSSFQDGASAARAVRGRFASPVFEGWSHSPPHGARVVGGRPNGPSSGARIVRPTPSRRRAHRSFSLGRRERRFSGSSLAGGAPWPRRSRPRWPPSGHLPRGSSRGCRSLHDVRRSEATIKRGLLRRRSRPGGAFDTAGHAPPFVVLVDDVLTTGATASACADALRSSGARRIHLMTAARALPGPAPRAYTRSGPRPGLWLPGDSPR